MSKEEGRRWGERELRAAAQDCKGWRACRKEAGYLLPWFWEQSLVRQRFS